MSKNNRNSQLDKPYGQTCIGFKQGFEKGEAKAQVLISEVAGNLAKATTELQNLKSEAYSAVMTIEKCLSEAEALMSHPENVKAAIQYLELARQKAMFLKGYSR